MNGKGDSNRSNSQAFRDGWDRVFGGEPVPHAPPRNLICGTDLATATGRTVLYVSDPDDDGNTQILEISMPKPPFNPFYQLKFNPDEP